MMKDLVKKRFRKSLKTYSNSAVVQKKMAEKLVKMLPEINYSSILELGCGCGLLTENIVNLFDFEIYDAIDMVEECNDYIKKISPKINFISRDLENYIPDKQYDLIISNASIQWLDNLPLFIHKIKQYLKPDGIFGFTIFGQENFKEFKTILNTALKYYSIQEIEKICSEYKIINVSANLEILDFKNPADVLRHIKNTGVNALSQTHWTKKDLTKFTEDYDNACNHNIKLTYNPLYVILQI